MPSDRADLLDEAYRRAFGLDDDVDAAHVTARREGAVGQVLLAAERAMRAHRNELAVLLCLAACRRGAPVEGVLEETLSAAFAAVRCLHVAPDAHPGGADCVAWSPDDAMLASGGADGGVVLWSGEELRHGARLKGHEERVRRIEFNEVWPLVSTCGDDGAAVVWDVASCSEAWRVQGADASALAARFSPCGRWTAVAGGAAWSGLHDVRTGERVLGFDGHDGIVVYDVAFSPDGRRLATCGDDGRAIVRDVPSGALVGRIEHSKPVRSVAFDPSGSRLACASYDGAASVLSLQDGSVRTVHGEGRLFAASFVNGGRDLWIVPEHGAHRIFAGLGQDDERETVLTADVGRTRATSVRRDGRVFAHADHDGTAVVQEFVGGRIDTLAVLRSAGAATHGVDLTSDATRVATADADGSVRVWSLRPEDAAKRTSLRGQALLDAALAWRRASGRAPSRRELELLAVDAGGTPLKGG